MDSNGIDPFHGSGWDQLFAMNQAITSSNMVHYHQSDSSLVDIVPKIPSFGSGSFSEMVNTFGLPECAQMSHQSLLQNKEKALQDEGANSSLSEKRKRKSSEFISPFNSNKNIGEDQPKISSRESSESSKEENKTKPELIKSGNTRNKHTNKQTINSNNGEPSNDDYIHVRAKRGQATNSHSLAERVRRERISERMRLLQELVPGCNKITGKAMMLDEIINYVQSLQQQVEFLSMKLATVNPEVNIDIERLLSKDIRGASANTHAISQGLNSGHSFPGIPQGNFSGIPSITPPFHQMPQNVWDNELQSLLQMGFDPNNLGPNGR